MEVSPLIWAGFVVFIVAILALDLGLFHRHAHSVTAKEAAGWTAVWVSLALAFMVVIYFWMGPGATTEFLTGYLVEYSLSVDNIFVFIMIFSYFNVVPDYRHRVLFWGIIGALVLRALLIAVGAALIERFEWVIYLFGAFLVYTGGKMALSRGEAVEPEHNPVVRWFRKLMPVTSAYEDDRFFIRRAGRLMATPLLIVLLVVETTDVMFALDSIPAIFGITHDPFIVFTSNVFAILGLRSLFFLLDGIMGLFHFLKLGLSAVLSFIGIKMLISGFYHIPTLVSLGVVAGILAVSMILSLIIRPAPQAAASEDLRGER